jgi:DNA modification methylase
MTDGYTLDDLPQPVERTTVHPEELHVDGDNPNEQSDEMFGLLVENMRSKGWLGNAIVADTDGCIADGEHRWRAAQEIGLTEVPVKFYDIDDDQRRLWRQELNKISGDHDPKRDALEYDHLLSAGKTEEVEALTEAADEDLDELLAQLRTETGQSPPYEYDLDHNVYFEDCVEGMRERLDDDSVDCVITDPPYGIDWQSSHREKEFDTVTADGDIEEAIGLYRTALTEISRILKSDGHLYTFTRWDVYPEFLDTTSEFFDPQNCLVWAKNNWGMGHIDYDYRPQHEFIIFACGEDPRPLTEQESNLLEYARPPSNEYDHPTEKPVALVEKLLSLSTDPGDRILDPFMGSGTTAVAAIQNDRDYVGFEIDDEPKKLRCHVRYYVDGELKNQTGRMHQSHDVVDGKVQHDGVESDLHEFIRANFTNDPELELGEVFEDYVN